MRSVPSQLFQYMAFPTVLSGAKLSMMCSMRLRGSGDSNLGVEE